MKTIFSFLIIGLLFLIACNPQTSSPPTNEEPPAITETEPEPEHEPVFVEVPLSYEAEGYIRQDMACVEITNTDTISGTFLVIFSLPESTNQPTISEIPDLEQDFLEAFREAEMIRPKDYEVLEAKSRYETAYVTLRNTDTVAATFTISFYFTVTTLDYPYVETHNSQAEVELYLEPGEAGTAQASAKYYGEHSTMTCSYSIWPGIEFPEQSINSDNSEKDGISELLSKLEEGREEIYELTHPYTPLVQELSLQPGETGFAEYAAYDLTGWSFEIIPGTKLIEQ